jgi:hypothetical protein
MEVPVQNIVETVDLTSGDALLPLFECVVNSIISLMQTKGDAKEIQIKIIRGDSPTQTNIENIKTIHSIVVTDNGVGFNERHYLSFKTPFSKLLRDYGCKGIGRFTILAAFRSIRVRSTYSENGKWKYREFICDSENEVTPVRFEDSVEQLNRTNVELVDCFNLLIKDKTALTVAEIAQEIMQHCLIYYLSGDLPTIKLFDTEDNKGEVINDLFARVSKEHERSFSVRSQSFKAYITKTPKEGNRKNHYIYYCANSRVVGTPKNIGKYNGLFSYPLNLSGQLYFLDVYVVSTYLNEHVYKSRNGFALPAEKENGLFANLSLISLDEIDEELLKILEKDYEPHVKEMKERSQGELQKYILENAPRFGSLAKNPELLKSIPPNLTDDKKEEHLYKIVFSERKKVEKSVRDFIENKQINEETIQKIKNDIKEKTANDIDSLADYMMRRKAIIELFDKFLEADSTGKYKLEEDIHSLIFPMGITNDEISYETHNLWLLDERFLMYKFIASDKSITSFSEKQSSKEPDLIMLNDKPQMFGNPISFGDKNNGELNSMVIFEFKRPGDTAHQTGKKEFRWEFSELVEPYFDEFLYSNNKKNYRGKQVVLKKETPKFGFIIIDVLPPLLEQYNIDKGWQKTPFGTYYKMISNKNMHLEVMTFAKLIEYAKSRHMPFFDKLFGTV